MNSKLRNDILDRLRKYASDVVNVRNASPDQYLYVGRGQNSRWGNPFLLMQGAGENRRRDVIIDFTRHVRQMQAFERRAYLTPIAEALAAGKKLGCWCSPKPCHAWVLAAWARAEFPDLLAPEPEGQDS